MARRPHLVQLCQRLEDEIEQFTEPGRGHVRWQQLLYRELWELLELGTAPRKLVQTTPKARRLVGAISRHIDVETANALRKAIYDRMAYRTALTTIARWWSIRQSEIRYVEALAKDCAGRIGELQERANRHVTPWKGEVDKHHELVDVLISDRAHEEMVLTALEAYSVPPRPRALRKLSSRMRQSASEICESPS